MSQSEDLAAINSYFSRTGAKNAQATAAKNNFFTWYKSLGLWAKSMDSATLAEAQQRRINFNALNGDIEDVAAPVSAAERAEWLSRPVVNTTGMTPEEAAKAVWTPRWGKPSADATLGTPVNRPTIRQGSTGKDVADWQRILGMTADGKFGPQTKASTIAWQKAHGLVADGVVGPKTWTAAIAESSSGGSILDQVVQQVQQVFPGGGSGTAPAPRTAPAVRPVAKPAAPKLATAPRASTGTGAGTAPAARGAPAIRSPAPVAAMVPSTTLPGWVKWTGLGAVVAVVGSVVALVARRK